MFFQETPPQKKQGHYPALLEGLGLLLPKALSSHISLFLFFILNTTIFCLQKCEKLVLGEALLLTVGAFLFTVKLLCLQSLNALNRRTFPLCAKNQIVSKKAEIVSKKLQL